MKGAELINLIGGLANGGPSFSKFTSLFQGIGGGVDSLATMIINTQNGLQNDVSGQISKITGEINNLAVVNATYVATKAIGKDVTGMPSAESTVKSINTRIQTELKDSMDKAGKLILRPLQIEPSASGPSQAGGFKRAKTLKNVSVTHRTKTHRRPAVVSKV
jgi:hypothetical protein